MLSRVRLELARTREFPEGNANCGYEFVVPLDADGRFDAEAWQKDKARCTVRRFWAGADDEQGLLIHTKGRRWAFSYAPGDDDDEPIFKFDRHAVKPGEYISITEHDGVTRPFRVAAVTALKAAR